MSPSTPLAAREGHISFRYSWTNWTAIAPSLTAEATRLTELERTGADGKLVNVCTGTGKQKTLRAYLERPAINGRDDRGGAMGLLFATELLASPK